MKISKQTILLLGALVVLAIGSNLDAAGLKPDRGRGGGTRGKGGKGGVTKKDFKKSAQAAVKALTAKIKADFDQTIGGRKILKAVANGNDATFTRPLPNTINFANAKQSTNFGRIQTEATAIDAEITKYKKDLDESTTSDNKLMAIEKAAKNGGALYKQYEQFFNDLQTASLSPRNFAKTAAELKTGYLAALELAVPKAYNFSTSTNLGGNKLSVPAADNSWLVIKDDAKTKLSKTANDAVVAVQDAQAAYKDALDIITAISKVDAAGVMQKADNSEITAEDITDAIARAKKAVEDAQTAVNGAFEPNGGGPKAFDWAASDGDFAALLATIKDDTSAKDALNNWFYSPNPADNKAMLISTQSGIAEPTTNGATMFGRLTAQQVSRVSKLKEAIVAKLTSQDDKDDLNAAFNGLV